MQTPQRTRDQPRRTKRRIYCFPMNDHQDLLTDEGDGRIKYGTVAPRNKSSHAVAVDQLVRDQCVHPSRESHWQGEVGRNGMQRALPISQVPSQ